MLCLINGALFLLAMKLIVGHKYIECIDTGSSSPTSSIWTHYIITLAHLLFLSFFLTWDLRPVAFLCACPTWSLFWLLE